MDNATLADWMHLLGTGDVVPDVIAGQITPKDACEALLAVRSDYPNVSQDYVAIIDLAIASLMPIEDMISQQDEAIDAWNAQAARDGLRFDHDPGKLLGEDDQHRFDVFIDKIAALAESRAREKQRLEREMEKAHEEALDIATEIESDMEDAQQQVASAAAELAAAVSEYEAELAKLATEREPTWSGSVERDVATTFSTNRDPDPNDWFLE